MTILRDSSVLISLIIKMFMTILLIEMRYPKKKSYLLATALFAPLVLVNIFLFVYMEPQRYTTFLFFFLSLPSILILWFLTRYRDGRFIFTLCMVDTLAIEIGHITNIIDYYIPGETYLFMFVSRLVIFPLLLLWIYRYFHRDYLDLQQYTKKGWGTFAIIGLIFYVIITLAMSYPSMIFERLEYLPVLIMVFVLMPMVYLNIINTLYRQKQFHEMHEQDTIWQLQIANVVARVEELNHANDQFREERHNFRHKLKAISSLVVTKQYDELEKVLEDYADALDRTRVIRYCKSAILDSVLSVYIQKAESLGIPVKTGFAFPDVFAVSETELATAFANAMENAINACMKLPEAERFLEIKVLCKPQFIIMVRNSFDGAIEFAKDGIPLSHEDGHGFGTRSIAAFCTKNDGYYEFQVNNNIFTLFMHLK